MENKQKTAQELGLDQMEKVSGGDGNEDNICPWCGQIFGTLLYKRFRDHVRNCPEKPVEDTIIP